MKFCCDVDWCCWSWWRYRNWKQKLVIYNQKWQKGWRNTSIYSATFPSMSFTHIMSLKSGLSVQSTTWLIYPGDTLTTGIRRAIGHAGKKEQRAGSISQLRHLQILHLVFPYIPKSPEVPHGVLQGSTFCCEEKGSAWTRSHPVSFAVDLFLICS